MKFDGVRNRSPIVHINAIPAGEYFRNFQKALHVLTLIDSDLADTPQLISDYYFLFFICISNQNLSNTLPLKYLTSQQ